MKRETSTKNQRGDAHRLRAEGFTVYRYFADVPSELATATALKMRGLIVTDETPIADYVLSGDARKRYALFRVNDPTLRRKPVSTKQD